MLVLPSLPNRVRVDAPPMVLPPGQVLRSNGERDDFPCSEPRQIFPATERGESARLGGREGRTASVDAPLLPARLLPCFCPLGIFGPESDLNVL